MLSVFPLSALAMALALTGLQPSLNRDLAGSKWVVGYERRKKMNNCHVMSCSKEKIVLSSGKFSRGRDPEKSLGNCPLKTRDVVQ